MWYNNHRPFVVHMESSSKFGRGELGSAFCCVDGFIISRLYFLCHIFPQTSELNSKIKYKNDPSVNDLLKAGVICYGLLHRDSSPEIEYELTYASFYISISDSWAVTIITFPYAYNMNNQKFHIGTYDVSKKKWTWTQN